MKSFNIPKIGLRNLKTALAVFCCMILFNLLNRDNSFYACISAVICMKDTVENSLTMGKDRLLGTLLGGICGIIFIYFISQLPPLNHPNAILTSLGIIIIIYFCTIINKPGSVTIACIVFIGIMITFTGVESYYYAINRSIDTAIGVIIAVAINKYVSWPVIEPSDKSKS